ncbi:MAG: hypothetical protein U9R08_00665 [Nanoarchaeota archaeon]|nr:hypothetical protein [Nanoarchaeota archaeon]
MFKFIRNLFKKVEPNEESIKLDQLVQFFNNKKSEVLKPLNENITQFYQDIKAEFIALEQKIPALEEASIGKDDKNLPAKIKNTVDGHRKQYIKRVQLFIDRCKVPEDIKEIKTFLEKLDTELEEFNKSTFKSYRASQHLFFKPVENIVKSLKEINSKLNSLKSLFDKHQMDELESLEKDIKELFHNIDLKEILQKQYKEQQSNLKQQQKLLEEKIKNIQELKQSPEYKTYEQQKIESARLNTQLKQIEFTIINLFSIFERAFRKYSKVAVDSRLINTYLTNPVVALINDKEKTILSVFTGLQKSILKLGLNEKRIEKINQTIKDIRDSESIDKLQDNYNTIIKQIGQVEESLKSIDILDRLKDLDKDITHLELSIEKIKKGIEEPDENKPETLLTEIQDKFFKLFNIKLIIK